MFQPQYLTAEQIASLFDRSLASLEARRLQAEINAEIVRVVDGRTDEAAAAEEAMSALLRLQERIGPALAGKEAP